MQNWNFSIIDPLWSWDNEHTLDRVKEQSFQVKAFGEQAKFPKLTAGLFESDEFGHFSLSFFSNTPQRRYGPPPIYCSTCIGASVL